MHALAESFASKLAPTGIRDHIGSLDENPLATLPRRNHGARRLLDHRGCGHVTSGAHIEWIGPRSQVPTLDHAGGDLQGAWVTPA
jgi:hypothetical protein